MKNLITILIVGIGVVMLATGLAWSEDVTAHIGGTPVNTLTITSSDLSYADTGADGTGDPAAMTGSPVEGNIINNRVVPQVNGVFLQAILTGSAPDQYDDDAGGGEAYYLQLAEPIWTAASDDTCHVGAVVGSKNLNYETPVDILKFTAMHEDETILHGSFEEDASLVLNDGWHIKGNTNDSLTVQYTLVDFAAE